MRYEDASGAFQASGPIANDDQDTLSAGQKSASGNLITGEGTQYGAAGADSAAGAHITAIAGKGGEDSSFAGGKLSVTGEHGRLSVDAEGNYNYIANKGTPENVRDRFVYTLADNQGNSDTAALIVEIGKTPAVIKADAQQIVPGPDGVVTLPPGVELSDIMVVGRNLVVNMPDGTQLVIIDGAIFVPQLQLGGVEVPASNVATLLIGQEPQPAAGELPPSSGGNFALPPPPLDPGIPLGDLIPPTEYDYIPPEPQEVLDQLDSEPTIVIQPDGQPASVAAADEVDEAGLPTRNGSEPEGSGEEAAGGADGDPSEATAGTIIIDSPDGVDSVSINGVLVTGVVGQQIAGEFGTLTITGFDGDNILYSYVLDDNTSGDATHDDFSVEMVDEDGDVATATLTIDIIDDVPTARNDTDAVVKGDTSTDGNVMTAVGTTNSPAGVDTVGADDAELTGIHAGTSGSFTAVPGGGVTVNGTFGDLTINPDGSYTYTLHAEVGDGGNDIFTYQLTDGDGDTSTATLTIAVSPDLRPTLDAPNLGEAGTVVHEAGLPARPGEPGEPEGTGEEAAAAVDGDPREATTGEINFTPGDTPATITINDVVVAAGVDIVGDYGTLHIDTFNVATGVITYTYTLADNVDHDTDATPFEEFDIVITDADGDSASDTLQINIVDDAPIANDDTDSVTEDGPLEANGNVITGIGSDGNPAGDDLVGADGSIVTNVDGLNPGIGSAVATPGGAEIVGQYGTLIIHTDGSYTYTLDNANPVVQALSDGDTLEEQFEYTLLDGDGDTDTAVLTITINGENDIPTVDVPTRGEDGTIVDETGLPARPGEPEGLGEANAAGANGDPSEITSGVVNYTPGDGATTITIGGVAITGPFPQNVVGEYGTLSITAHDPVAHTISYTYTLSDNVDHDSDATPFETFEVVVSDADGNPADDATGDLIIDIINDVPLAAPDTDSVVEGGSTNGNVLTGVGGDGIPNGVDLPGADDFAPNTVVGVEAGDTETSVTNGSGVGVVVSGLWGDLVLNADGSYTYTANPDTNPPPGTEDVFTYTIIDKDGNASNAELVITVIDDLTPTLDVPDTGEAGTVVDEKGLPTRPGEPEGSGEAANPAPNTDNSEITSGTINFTPGDEPATVTIDGFVGGPVVITMAGQTIVGEYGTLLINNYNAATGVITYTYTLTDNVDHDSDLTPVDTFTVTVEDVDGDVATDDLVINIINDAPIARDDTDSVVEGASTDGNVLTGAGTTSGAGGADTPGADNFAPSGVVGVVTGGNDAVDTNNPATVGVAIVGAYGTLTLNANGTYTYQATAVNPPPGATDVFTYTVIDNDGNMDSATLTISVIDDLTPTLDVPDTGEAGTIVDEKGLPTRPGEPEGSGEAANPAPNTDNSEITSGTINFTPGDAPATVTIDGFVGGPVVITMAGQTIVGEYGTLVINSFNAGTGVITYTYTLGDNVDHDTDLTPVDTFTVTVTDVDGDTATDDLVINIINDAPIARDDTDSVVEGAATNGNVLTGVGGDGNPAGADTPGADNYAPNTVVGVVTGGNDAVDTVNGNVGNALVGTYGTLTLNANGTYTYTANPNTNPPPGATDVFTYTIIDNDGNMDSATLTISVIDDLVPDVPENTIVGLDDDALGGNPGTPAVNDDPDSVNASGSVAAVGGDLPITYALLATGAPAGFSYQLQGNGDLWVIQDGGTHVLTITLDQSGNYEVTQVAPIDHAMGNLENNQPFTVTFRATDVDGDFDEGTLSISVDDDTPVVTLTGDPQGNLTVDETNLDVNAGPTSFADQFDIAFGADGAGPGGGVSFTLGVNPGSTGLVDTASGEAVILVKNGDVVEGRTENGNVLVFTVSVNASGNVTLDQVRAISHPNPNDPNESRSLAGDDLITLTATATDGDGDTASQTIGLGGNLVFVDDGPVITDVTDPLEIDNEGPTPTGTGDFDFDVGADENADFDDISVSNFGITINGSLAQNVQLFANQNAAGNPAAETAAAAFYRFTFEYDTGTGGTAQGEGTLVFDKSLGEYTVTITSGPIEGISFSSISTGQAPVGYVDGTNTLMPSNPDVSVVQIEPDLFVQFTGYVEPGSGTGANNFKTSIDNDVSAGDDENFASGEVLVQQRDYVTISGLGGNGVHGDTMNKGEILDLDLFTSNPFGFTDQAPTAQVETMFLWLDGIGANEDMIVVLKLYDTVTDTFTTKAVYVGNTEIFKDGATDAGIYQSLVDSPQFDNNDGLIVIEQNDYNTALEPDRYVIVGAQMTISDEGIVGSAIALDGDVGDAGASTGTTTFAADTNDTGFKIKDIGFLTTSTEDQQATIEFDVTVTDGDGDSVTQTDVTVNIGGAATTALAAPTSVNSLMASDSQEVERVAANSNSLTLATAVAAAGLSGKAAAHHDNGHNGHGQNGEMTQIYAVEQVERASFDDDAAAVSMLAAEPQVDDAAPASSSSSSADNASSSNVLDDSPAPAAAEANNHGSSGDEAPAQAAPDASPVAPAVAMVSAEALQAASVDGNAKHGPSVEQIVAEALGHADAPTVDGVLANLPGGSGSLPALAQMASPDGAAVSGWDMAGHGAVGAGFDMLFKVDVAVHHHDAVQPAVNG